MFTCWKEYRALIKNISSQSERISLLQKYVVKDLESHNRIVVGMLFGILLWSNRKQ
jgi:hypothetical protein